MDSSFQSFVSTGRDLWEAFGVYKSTAKLPWSCCQVYMREFLQGSATQKSGMYKYGKTYLCASAL